MLLQFDKVPVDFTVWGHVSWGQDIRMEWAEYVHFLKYCVYFSLIKNHCNRVLKDSELMFNINHWINPCPSVIQWPSPLEESMNFPSIFLNPFSWPTSISYNLHSVSSTYFFSIWLKPLVPMAYLWPYVDLQSFFYLLYIIGSNPMLMCLDKTQS